MGWDYHRLYFENWVITNKHYMPPIGLTSASNNEDVKKEYEEKRKLQQTNWGDLTSEQKIERMREIIKGLQYTANNANREVNVLKEKFAEHKHCENKIVVEYKKYGNELGGCSETLSQTKNYF